MNNASSFDTVRTWIWSIRAVKRFPILLVGNHQVKTGKPVVDREKAEKLAEEFLIQYTEISTLFGEGITGMMDNIMA